MRTLTFLSARVSGNVVASGNFKNCKVSADIASGSVSEAVVACACSSIGEITKSSMIIEKRISTYFLILKAFLEKLRGFPKIVPSFVENRTPAESFQR
jgi:hypothetical protein